MYYVKNDWSMGKQRPYNQRVGCLLDVTEPNILGCLHTYNTLDSLDDHQKNPRRIFLKVFTLISEQIYSNGVYKDNYLTPFSKELFYLLAYWFLLSGCVNIPDTIGWFSNTKVRVGTMSLGCGHLSNPLISAPLGV